METDELCLRSFSKWFLSKKLEHSINSPRKCLTSARFWKLELNISINWNDYWQLSVLVFISKSFELCFSYHCVSLLFTEPLMLVATMSLVGQIPECTNYLLLREVRRPQVKSASVYVNGLIKNQTQQTNKQTKPQNQTLLYTLSWCNFHLLMLSIKFSAYIWGNVWLWKTYYARITQTLLAAYK